MSTTLAALIAHHEKQARYYRNVAASDREARRHDAAEARDNLASTHEHWVAELRTLGAAFEQLVEARKRPLFSRPLNLSADRHA